MDTVRVGVIGLGGMGSNHAGYLSRGEIPGARLAAVCDVEPARLQNVSEKYGKDVQSFDSADALFEAKVHRCGNRGDPTLFSPAVGYASVREWISRYE